MVPRRSPRSAPKCPALGPTRAGVAAGRAAEHPRSDADGRRRDGTSGPSGCHRLPPLPVPPRLRRGRHFLPRICDRAASLGPQGTLVSCSHPPLSVCPWSSHSMCPWTPHVSTGLHSLHRSPCAPTPPTCPRGPHSFHRTLCALRATMSSAGVSLQPPHVPISPCGPPWVLHVPTAPLCPHGLGGSLQPSLVLLAPLNLHSPYVAPVGLQGPFGSPQPPQVPTKSP